MTNRQLEYFLAVARYLNFTRAAEAMYVSQTAITRQIQVLEEEIGASLFLRTKRHVELTVAGQIFLTEARAILERTQSAFQKARDAADGFVGQINIGHIRGYEKTSFSDMLMNFHRQNPGIRLELERNSPDKLAEELSVGKADLTFALDYADYLTEEEFRSLPIREYPLRAVLYKSHPFAQKQSVTLEELSGDNLLSAPPFRIYHCPEIENSFIMVAAEMGVCILPEYATRHLTTARNLTVLPVLNQTPVKICAYWRADNENPCLTRMLRTLTDFYNLETSPIV